jgi:hypothetical protein
MPPATRPARECTSGVPAAEYALDGGPGRRTGAFSACVRTTLETGRGPDGNRHSSRIGRAESVLIPRGQSGR